MKLPNIRKFLFLVVLAVSFSSYAYLANQPTNDSDLVNGYASVEEVSDKGVSLAEFLFVKEIIDFGRKLTNF